MYGVNFAEQHDCHCNKHVYTDAYIILHTEQQPHKPVQGRICCSRHSPHCTVCCNHAWHQPDRWDTSNTLYTTHTHKVQKRPWQCCCCIGPTKHSLHATKLSFAIWYAAYQSRWVRTTRVQQHCTHTPGFVVLYRHRRDR